MEHFESVDAYLDKSEQWPDEAAALVKVMRATGLDETIKWGKPCYTHEGANIALIQEFKDFLALMFIKGALLDDPEGVLESQGEATRSALRMTFTSVDDVKKRAKTIKAYVKEAVAVEESGAEVGPAPEPEVPEELQERLAADAALSEAWDGLTPGRRRAYVLHIAGAKQAKTRASRVDKHVPRILAGKGLNDR